MHVSIQTILECVFPLGVGTFVTNTCKNITFPKLRLRVVTKRIQPVIPFRVKKKVLFRCRSILSKPFLKYSDIEPGMVIEVRTHPAFDVYTIIILHTQ